MKARLNVLGDKLEVVSINYYADNISSVTIVDRNGNYLTYHDENNGAYVENALKVDLKKSLEFPELEQLIVENNNNLLDHLEEMLSEESIKLTNIAIDAMEGDEDIPFVETALLDKQKEYKLMQQRVLGIIDAIEEVKAYLEGWYANNDAATKA